MFFPSSTVELQEGRAAEVGALRAKQIDAQNRVVELQKGAAMDLDAEKRKLRDKVGVLQDAIDTGSLAQISDIQENVRRAAFSFFMTGQVGGLK